MGERMVKIDTTIEDRMYQRVYARAQAKHENVQTAVRQLILKGLFEENKKDVLEAYCQRKITLREIGEFLGISYWETQALLEKEGVPISNPPDEEVLMRMKEIEKDVY